MASYHVAGQILRRSEGHSAVAAASYRARMELVDERTGLAHDYSSISKDLIFAGMFAPQGAPSWARDRQTFWNRVEHIETRKDAQLAHEINIALPHELTHEQQRYALQDWVKEITRKGYVVDVAIHRAHDWGDQRNDHAHVMIALRKLDIPANDLSKDKDRYSLASLGEQMTQWRERWAHHANRRLLQAGFDIEIDHRSLEAQGIDRAATVHLGKSAAAMERRGIATEPGDTNRAIENTEQERARITAEIQELERVYQLEQDQVSHKLATYVEKRIEAAQVDLDVAEFKDRRAATARIDEIYADQQPISAIDRMREDDRKEVEFYQSKSNPAARSLLGALWSLTKTMGSSLSHIIMGADRASLEWGRKLDMSSMTPQGTASPVIEPTRRSALEGFKTTDQIDLFHQELAAPPFNPAKSRDLLGDPAARFRTAAQTILDRQEDQRHAIEKRAERERKLKEYELVDKPATPADRLQAIASQRIVETEQKRRQQEAAAAVGATVRRHVNPAPPLRDPLEVAKEFQKQRLQELAQGLSRPDRDLSLDNEELEL